MKNILFPGIKTDELEMDASVSIGPDSDVVCVSLNFTGDGMSFRKSDAEKLSRALKMQELTSERSRTPVMEVEKEGKAVVVEPESPGADSEEA